MMSRPKQPPHPPQPSDRKAADAATPGGTSDDARRRSGRVRFDDRGNAIWEWSVATGKFGRDVSTGRLKSLEHPALSIVDDAAAPAPTQPPAVRPNPLGTKKGYDPYDSGKLGKPKDGPRKRTDLRRLSEWMKLKKQASQNDPDEE